MSMFGKLSTYNRLRIETDGEGVTTLVAFYGCPLKCKYCINNNLYEHKCVNCSVEQLYDKVSFDDLYYTYTGGGICFGGHEPLLQSEFIKEFITYVRNKGKIWKFTVETSLNVEGFIVESLIDVIDNWIVDIKDMNNSIYKSYTGLDNYKVKENLCCLSNKVRDKVVIRIPLIKSYNSLEDIERSKQELITMGFIEDCFDVFEYVVR